jgi:hypothetical protein
MQIVSVSWQDGTALWIDGGLVDATGDRKAAEAVLAAPVEVWEHVDLMGQPEGLTTTQDVKIGDAELTRSLPPGSAEHAAIAFRSLPGAILTQGEEFIPAAELEEPVTEAVT